MKPETLADELYQWAATRLHAMTDAELTRQLTLLAAERESGCRLSAVICDWIEREQAGRQEPDTDPATTFMDLASLGDDDEPITAKDTPTSKSQDRLEAVRPEEEPTP